MVEIPCGREYDVKVIDGVVRSGWFCHAVELCPNCTALRSLTAACEALAEFADKHAREHEWNDLIAAARAALAAARPAEQKERVQ